MSMHSFEIRIETPGNAMAPFVENGDNVQIERSIREATQAALINQGYTNSTVLDIPADE